ncbi:MAG: hypothetical protein ACKOEW_03880 [Methylocystis sp.]
MTVSIAASAACASLPDAGLSAHPSTYGERLDVSVTETQISIAAA